MQNLKKLKRTKGAFYVHPPTIVISTIALFFFILIAFLSAIEFIFIKSIRNDVNNLSDRVAATEYNFNKFKDNINYLKLQLEEIQNKSLATNQWFLLTEDPTTGWLIYKNMIKNYQLTFPKNWIVERNTVHDLLVRDKNSVAFLWISIPPLGFGYDKEKAVASQIILSPNLTANKFELPGLIVIEFKIKDTDSLIRFSYPEGEEEYSQIFDKIIRTFKIEI
jgi:hypothetical protein